MNGLLTQIASAPRVSTRRHLADQLRDLILSRKLPVGYKFPSNKELSNIWQISSGSVQTIMSALTKEGLLERAPKVGTFVAERSKGLTRVGIYLWRDIWHEPSSVFFRTLVSQISAQLEKIGVETDILIDSRSREDRGLPWPELVRLVDQRRIQALLMPNTTQRERPWISRLPIPWVEWTTEPIRNRVGRQPVEEERLAVLELARMGCRSVGMISPTKVYVHFPGEDKNEPLSVSRTLQNLAGKLGLRTEAAWLVNGWNRPGSFDVPESESERFGYEAMSRILALPDRPEGIFVTHDWVARGALTAILKSRIAVPEELKLVFFRNREIDWVCPIPVSFLEGSIAQVASAMIDIMQAQLRGETFAPAVRQLKIVPATENEFPVKMAISRRSEAGRQG